jgi:N-acetylglutamate synthase-like GNAT family acetyltransferase
MPRQAPQIRDATPQDAVELLALWAGPFRTDQGSARAVEDAERALTNLELDPDQRVVVAEADGRVVAAVKLSRGPLSPLSLDSVVHTSFMVVHPQYRRHGYGHALMDAALTWAEEKDIDSVTAITDGNRETNRFFARLGLSTAGNVRHSSVGNLRKKLTAERGRVAGGGNRHLVEVLAQRRSMRRRQAAG